MNTQRVHPIRIMAAAVAALSCTAMGATSTAHAAQPPVTVASITSTASPPTLEEVIARRDRSSRLALSGNFRSARGEWARVARLQRSLGEPPLEALRMQAEMDHVLGREAEAAAVLKGLGEEALAGGNPEVSAQAFLDAASLSTREQGAASRHAAAWSGWSDC